MNDLQLQQPNADILQEVVKPKIYSKSAVFGFSLLFTPIFGGILLVQNLKDIGEQKKANIVLVVSILMAISTFVIMTIFEIDNRAVSFGLNGACAAVLSEYFYKKSFPDEADYQKKKIWKPLVIAMVIFIAVLLLIFFAQDAAIA